jgi:acyl-CoA synthetase (AMP-forming)/AMP-acid ligase II
VADAVPDREAVVADARRLTYRELDERATRLAHGLAALGVTRRAHVGLYLYNCPEFLEAMLACFKLRAVPINVSYRYVGEELAYLVEDADLVVLLHPGALAHEVKTAVRQVRQTPALIEVDDGGEPRSAVPPNRRYEDVLAVCSPRRDFAARSADDHYILYTGGTTGLPKGVVWRHEDIFFATLGGGNPGGPPIRRPADIAATVLVNRAQRVAPLLPPDDPGPDEFVALSLGPLIHASGQWLALGTLLGGGKVVLYTGLHMDMATVLELIERERVTMLTLVGDASAVPLIEAMDQQAGARDTASVRLLGSGGAMLSGPVKDRLLALFPSALAITEAIGSSESPVQALSLTTPKTSGDGPTPSLRFTAKAETMIVDDDLRPIPRGSGRVGRLATRGRVPLGYYKDADKSARTFVEIDGARWSLPGDMATMDVDGTVHLLGRGALCINTGGEKVYPEEVEAVLKAHPAVDDAVVVGAPHPRWGQQVVAVVQPSSPGDQLTLPELQAHCRGRLAGYKVPRAVHVVSEIPRSAAGKADYAWAASAAEETGELVGLRRRFRNLDGRAERRHSVRAPERVGNHCLRHVEELPGQLGVEIGVIAGAPCQVPRVGEGVGGGDHREHRPRELPEGQLHDLLHRPLGAEGGDSATAVLLEQGDHVAVSPIARLTGRSRTSLGRDGKELGTAHDVVDEVAHLPGRAGR